MSLLEVSHRCYCYYFRKTRVTDINHSSPLGPCWGAESHVPEGFLKGRLIHSKVRTGKSKRNNFTQCWQRQYAGTQTTKQRPAGNLAMTWCNHTRSSEGRGEHRVIWGADTQSEIGKRHNMERQNLNTDMDYLDSLNCPLWKVNMVGCGKWLHTGCYKAKQTTKLVSLSCGTKHTHKTPDSEMK